MTDSPADTTPEDESTPESDPRGRSGNDTSTDHGDSSLRRYAELGALGVLALLAVVSVFRFYFAASSAIDIWIASDFVPVFQAGFNLVVLFLAVAGISIVLRRMHG